MKYIQIDARGCGAGKTRNTIVPRIRNNQYQGVQTLLVVPSIRLQSEYRKFFCSDDIAIINSEHQSRESVMAQLQTVDAPVICITHAAFQLVPSSVFDKKRTDLIIDEVFNPYQSHQIKNFDSANRIWINTGEMFELNNKLIGEWQNLEVQLSTPPGLIDRNKWNQLTNSNFEIYTSVAAANNLVNNESESTELFQVLREDVLLGWRSVWIAAAVFQHTLFGHWLNSSSLEYTVVHEFECHKKTVDWHMPDDDTKGGFRWTKGKQLKEPGYLKDFSKYVDGHRTGRVIYNVNNNVSLPNIWGKKIDHNAHGVNEYSHYENYAYLSAINPNNNFKSFIQNHCGVSSEWTTHMSDPFAFAFSGYNAYQLLMRTALRDPHHQGVVNAFFVDTKLAMDIMNLFESQIQNTHPNIPTNKYTSKVEKSAPLTSAQRNKIWRDKQKAKKNTS